MEEIEQYDITPIVEEDRLEIFDFDPEELDNYYFIRRREELRDYQAEEDAYMKSDNWLDLDFNENPPQF